MSRYNRIFNNLILTALSLVSLNGCSRKEDKPVVAPPIKVCVMTVDGTRAGESQEYSGTVSAGETTTVSFAVPGTIVQLNAAEGQNVSKGQVLGRVRNNDYLNASNIAQAQLAEAQDAYERLKKLHEGNALPDIKWVEIQQKLKQAENSAEIAKRALDDAVLTSPVSGTISRKFADVGQNVMTMEPVYEIISAGNLTIDISVDERQLSNFKAGQKALVSFDIPEIGVIEGKVSSKSVVANPLTRTFTVKVSLPGNAKGLYPGMLGKVSFESTPKDSTDVITLPSQAVQLAENNQNFVWIVKDGKAMRRNVETNEFVAHGVIIKSGLSIGDSVIVEGMQKVGTGSKVIPVGK